MPKIALVRPPDSSFVTALGQKPQAPAIDMAHAKAQHRSYAGALRAAGLEVVLLPPSPGLPDACFVQDVAFVLPEGVILAWPAEPTRQGEVAAIRATCPSMARGSRSTRRGPWNGATCCASTPLSTPASPRYQRRRHGAATAGAEGMGLRRGSTAGAARAASAQRRQHAWPGAINAERPSGSGPLAADACLPQFAGLDIIVVPEDQAPAANCLALGESVIVPAGYPETAAQIRQRGFRVVSVPVDEFAKADGGVTCLSIVW